MTVWHLRFQKATKFDTQGFFFIVLGLLLFVVLLRRFLVVNDVILLVAFVVVVVVRELGEVVNEHWEGGQHEAVVHLKERICVIVKDREISFGIKKKTAFTLLSRYREKQRSDSIESK